MKLINADCIEAMKAMPENSVDSIVTDPPYGINFMGKAWDNAKILGAGVQGLDHRKDNRRSANQHAGTYDTSYQGALGFADFTYEWAKEALRVLKPGGHLVSFSSARTYHRMAVGIEDAGFEIRDQIMWVYGSGFPKSHNVSKGIDKAADAEREVVGVAGKSGSIRNSMNGDFTGGEYMATASSTPAAKQWDGWGTALKPAHEPIVLARKPLIGTVANNVLTFGTGGLNIDGSRVAGEVPSVPQWSRSDSNAPFDATGRNGEMSQPHSQGRWPANFIHDGSDEVVALFPTLHGSGNKSDTGTGTDKNYDASSYEINYSGRANRDYGSKGGSAARFFYCAKASKRDRNEGLDGFEITPSTELVNRKEGSAGMENPRAGAGRTSGSANHHPTVKPTTLMQYLVRLVTPPNGIVLDPFMGSGSTGKACAYEGFDFIGIDQSAEYCEIAKARIDFVHASLEQVLFPPGFDR